MPQKLDPSPGVIGIDMGHWTPAPRSSQAILKRPPAGADHGVERQAELEPLSDRHSLAARN
jgi:hypothetical protein